MEIIRDILHLKDFLKGVRSAKNLAIGFVPTMGALHKGHLSLVQHSIDAGYLTLCSIFVNPTQFNNPNDLLHYPRTEETDLELLRHAGCKAVFLPTVEMLYPKGTSGLLQIAFGPIGQVLEGHFRPGHFNGVGLVVAKLLNLVQPDRLFMGQKDLQQCLLVAKLIADLSYQVQLEICPTIRETDGLAFSSRNVRLSAQERALAPILYQALSLTARQYTQGITAEEARQAGVDLIGQYPAFQTEYFEVVETGSLQALHGARQPGTPFAVVAAAHLGQTRLIDNVFIE